MNDYVIAILAWIGFSPILGLALGRLLHRSGRPVSGDPFLNRGRPPGLPCFVANQVVAVKHASSRSAV